MGVSLASVAFSHRRPVVLAPAEAGRVLQVELGLPVCSCLYLVFHAFCSAKEDNVFNVVERVFRVRQGRWKRRTNESLLAVSQRALHVVVRDGPAVANVAKAFGRP